MPDRMIRQTVSLTTPQAKFLAGTAEMLGITVSELVRRIIDEHRDIRPSGHIDQGEQKKRH